MMLTIAFNLDARIAGATHKITHPEPLLCLILDLPRRALIHNDEEFIDVQNNEGNDCALIRIMQDQ